MGSRVSHALSSRPHPHIIQQKEGTCNSPTFIVKSFESQLLRRQQRRSDLILSLQPNLKDDILFQKHQEAGNQQNLA
jgi:hypothetical protein